MTQKKAEKMAIFDGHKTIFIRQHPVLPAFFAHPIPNGHFKPGPMRCHIFFAGSTQPCRRLRRTGVWKQRM
jgi:hypothetical protein